MSGVIIKEGQIDEILARQRYIIEGINQVTEAVKALAEGLGQVSSESALLSRTVKSLSERVDGLEKETGVITM